MARTPSCDKSGLRKGTWTAEEDRKLIAYVTRYGCWNWRQLPRFAGLARCGKSCRLRWMNYLRPNLKRGNFTQEEEECIIRMHKKMGNRWSAIAAALEGRTDNEVKNHWHTTLKKRYSQQNNNTVTINEEAKAKDSVTNNIDVVSVLQVNTTPATSNSQFSDITGPWSPLSSSSEFSSITSDHSSSTAANNEKFVFEDDFGFLDAFTDPVNEDFWTEPFLADLSYNSTNCASQNQLDTTQIFNDAYVLSPHQSSSESLVLENDFGSFLDAYTVPTIDSFWTQPYVADDMSYVPTEPLTPTFVAESEYFSTVYDADLWS